MKPSKKETVKTKDKTKETKKNISDKRMKELEDLVLLMDKKIITLEGKMDSIDGIFKRIRSRIGVWWNTLKDHLENILGKHLWNMEYKWVKLL